MTKEEVLHYFQDINYMYNDCGMQDTLSKCLDEYADEIRADAIDEFAKYIDTHSHISADGCEVCLDDDVTILAEHFKEQKNE